MKHYNEEELFSYIDGTCDSQSALQLERHLVDCPHCNELYETLLSVDSQLQLLPKEKPSAHFTSAIMEKLYVDPRHSVPFSFTYYTRYFLIFGLVVSVISLFISLFSIGIVNDGVLQHIGLNTYLFENISNTIIAFFKTGSFINIMLGVSTLLLLVLLDKAVLNPFFNKRSQKIVW